MEDTFSYAFITYVRKHWTIYLCLTRFTATLHCNILVKITKTTKLLHKFWIWRHHLTAAKTMQCRNVTNTMVWLRVSLRSQQSKGSHVYRDISFVDVLADFNLFWLVLSAQILVSTEGFVSVFRVLILILFQL